MTLDGVTRREFIKMLGMFTAGAACGLNPLESEASEGEYDFQMPPDRELKQYLNQPVEDTIGTPGVDYIPVKDENYDQIVKGSNKPVMVLFYVDDNEPNYKNPSRGLAGLAKVLNDTFQEDNVKEGYAGDDILFCAYQIKEGKAVYDESIDRKMYSTYPIDDMPSLIFYRNDGGENQVMGPDFDWYGGIEKMDTLKNQITWYTREIPQQLLD